MTRSSDLWADRRLVMRASPIHGIGTFATESIAAGEVLTRWPDHACRCGSAACRNPEPTGA